jgi:nitric oxide synthase-interacting protein
MKSRESPTRLIATSPTCPFTPISLKTLTPVTFSFTSEPSSNGSNHAKQDGAAICPSCKKTLSNSILMFCQFRLPHHLWFTIGFLTDVYPFRLIVLTSCSHVVCKTCTDTLVRPASQCVVCDKEAPSRKIVELKREGVSSL